MVPKDPMILLSWLNTQLRDRYDDLDALCADQALDRRELEDRLAALGFTYDADRRRFR